MGHQFHDVVEHFVEGAPKVRHLTTHERGSSMQIVVTAVVNCHFCMCSASTVAVHGFNERSYSAFAPIFGVIHVDLLCSQLDECVRVVSQRRGAAPDQSLDPQWIQT